MQKKDLPEPTLPNLLPPNLDHRYFEDGDKHPFRPKAQALELVNAWWLAEAALLAYAPEPFVKETLRRAGLNLNRFLSQAGTQCYVATSGDFVIVAFRGTQVPKPGADPDRLRLLQEVVADVEADAGFFLVEWGRGGCVHDGFMQAFDVVWPEVRDELAEHVRQRRSIWVTGHSLGAALATLAADRLGGVQGLYTYGSPRVGDRAFADDFHVPAHRFVHHRDIVTQVPPFGLYKAKPDQGDYMHIGALRYVDGDGRLHDREPGPTGLGGQVRETVHSLFTGQARARLGHLLDIAREPFDDHEPIYYAIRTWNLYVDSRS
jgi:hypothetical protein